MFLSSELQRDHSTLGQFLQSTVTVVVVADVVVDVVVVVVDVVVDGFSSLLSLHPSE